MNEMLSSRDTVEEAMEYALQLIEGFNNSHDRIFAITALMVVVNTIDKKFILKEM